MNSANNTTIGGFLKAYNMLPAGVQSQVKAKIKSTCDWNSESTFYGKAKGNAPLRKLERAALEAIFEAWNLNAWTGEYIKQAV